MNGQDQPLNQGTPSPASFGSSGFGGEATTPNVSAWNPATIPTPGPIENKVSVPVPTPVFMPTPLSASPMPTATPMEPIPSPFSAPFSAAPIPAPAPNPVAPDFSPISEERQAFTTPPLVVPSPTPQQAPMPTPTVPMPFAAPASMPTIASRSFEMPVSPVAQATPPTFATPVATAPVPPPPSTTSTIDLRTMASDVSSLQATGGAEAVPQSFSPEAFTGGDSSAVFSPTEVVAMEADKPKGKIGKTLLISGVVILTLALATAAAYFFLYDKADITTPEVVEEVAPPVVEVPASEVPVPLTETPEAGQPVSVPEQLTRPHSSFFSVAADTVEQKVISSVSLEEIKKAFYVLEEGASAPADGFMKEVVLTRSGTGFVNFPEFLGTFLPELNPDSVKSLFNDDFTAFVYQDRTNSMMGFIASTKPEASPEAVTSFTSSFETAKGIGNFYATDPGAPATSWKGGFVSGKPVQYLAFPKVGYAFDYGWFKDENGRTYLVVSASYAGMREAVRRAGL